ncbi:MAG: hypothetical protein ABF292_05105, partial [Desulfobacterales bacterium]
ELRVVMNQRLTPHLKKGTIFELSIVEPAEGFQPISCLDLINSPVIFVSANYRSVRTAKGPF